jgi:hypothetical protein
MNKKSNIYLEMATDYLMDVYEVNYDEAMSIMASNPEILNVGFGLEILFHKLNKQSEKDYIPLI